MFDLPPLKLPDNLPASREARRCGSNPHEAQLWSDLHETQLCRRHTPPVDQGCWYVRYFLKAKIDIAWWKDPFVRAAFSVAPRCPADSIPTQIASVPQMSKGIHPGCYCPPFCCHSECACFELDFIDQGSITLQGSVDKLHAAPGELLVVNATAANRSERKVSFVVKLRCKERAWAEGRTQGNHHDMELLRLDVPPGTENFALTNRVLTVPQCPASYYGGFLVDDAWTATINQFGSAPPGLEPRLSESRRWNWTTNALTIPGGSAQRSLLEVTPHRPRHLVVLTHRRARHRG